MRRWGHGNTLAAGLAGGLLLDRHALTIGAACFAVGIITGRLWRYVLAFGWALRARLERTS